MTKFKLFLIILTWQIVGFVATVVMALPSGDFHHFTHELMLCLTFTNLVGISGLLLLWIYQSFLKSISMHVFWKFTIIFLGATVAVAFSLKVALDVGGFICGLDHYQVNRWHLSILVVNFVILVVIGIVAILLALYERLASRLETKIRENEKLQRLQIESKLSLLQSKINPHFLFNTLNTMLDVLKKNPTQVEKIILNLSDIYRKTLMMPDNSLVPLEDEITLVEEYLEIEKVRMGDRLRYKFQIENRLKSKKIPPMMLQILVENAIKHGLSPKKEGGDVTVKAIQDGHTITLEVLDTGIGLESCTSSSGFGLASIRQRLALMYENAKMEIFCPEPAGTCVRIRIPA